MVVGFAWFGRWLARRLYLLRWGSENPYLDSLLRRGVRLAMLLVGVLIALDLLGATALVGAVLGSAGVLGIMLGFAFRDIAENHLAGVSAELATAVRARRPHHARWPRRQGDLAQLPGHDSHDDGWQPPAPAERDGVQGRAAQLHPQSDATAAVHAGDRHRRKTSTAVRRLGVETLRSIPAIVTEPEPRATIQSVGDSSV
jgi:small conductance mechanosensitive channel